MMINTSKSFTQLDDLPGQITDRPSSTHRSSVVTDQPRQSLKSAIRKTEKQRWMVKPVVLEPCPYGFEYLTVLKSFLVKQDFPTSLGENRYSVKNGDGEIIYRVQETFYDNLRIDYGSGFGPGYVLQLFDELNKEVMRFNRPVKKMACCWCAGKHCESCSHLIIVEASSEIIGYVGQNSSCWKPYVTIMDADKKKKYRIRGPCCFTTDINDFEIFTADFGTYAGKLYSKISNNGGNTDNTADYEIIFPAKINLNQKALLLAALFLIDSLFFEVRIVDD